VTPKPDRDGPARQLDRAAGHRGLGRRRAAFDLGRQGFLGDLVEMGRNRLGQTIDPQLDPVVEGQPGVLSEVLDRPLQLARVALRDGAATELAQRFLDAKVLKKETIVCRCQNVTFERALDAVEALLALLVLGLVAELGGSISAEHGIGTAKKQWLHLNRSAAEIAAMRAIKRALDPAGILNPNVLLPS